jgi:DNA-binding response OmpR family regulator
MNTSSPDKTDVAKGRALVVEDEPNIRELISLHLGLEGLQVTTAVDGESALKLAGSDPFDVVVLDLMLPKIDGVTVCRAIRREGSNADVPILMLTARGEEADKVVGLESGADDYVAKPFGIRELLARIEALLRRQRRASESPAAPAPRIAAGALALDVEKRQATVRGTPVELTRQEFDLLALLAARPGMVFSRAALLQQVWRGDAYVTERTVDTVVSRLRRKVELDAQNPEMILTAWGVGYKFADSA